MNTNLKLGKFRLAIWWALFFVFQGISAIAIAGIISSDHWVYANFSIETSSIPGSPPENNDTLTNGFNFTGTLFSCSSGCSGSYSSLSSNWCGLYTDLTLNSTSLQNASNSLCKTFTGLTNASLSFGICSVLTVFLLVLWFFSMLCSLKRVKYIYLSVISGIFSCIFFTLGSILWFYFAHATFSSSCTSDINKPTPPDLCADSAPAMMTVLMILLPLICIFMNIIVSVEAYKETKKIQNTLQMSAEDGSQNTDVLRNSEPGEVRILQNGKEYVFVCRENVPAMCIDEGPEAERVYDNPEHVREENKNEE